MLPLARASIVGYITFKMVSVENMGLSLPSEIFFSLAKNNQQVSHAYDLVVTGHGLYLNRWACISNQLKNIVKQNQSSSGFNFRHSIVRQ